MSKLEVKINIEDTELFKNVIGITKEFLEDENVTKSIRQKYERKIESVIDKAE